MSMEKVTIVVDSSACVRCGMCVRDCPNGVLALPSDGQVPHCVAPEECISCAHCVCVCPTGALRLKGLKDDSIVPKLANPASREQVAALVRERRSVRQFRPEPLPHSVIRDLLATSCSAPTAGNSRNVNYVVVEKPELLAEIRVVCCDAMRKIAAADSPIRSALEGLLKAVEAGNDVLMRGAPQLLVAHAPVCGPTADVDLAIALTTTELMAASMGLGTYWNGIVFHTYSMSPEMQELFEKLGVPRGSRIEVLMIGKPAVKYARAVVRDPPKIVFN
eukprot:m51a1_g408 hypothetical protein (276) ;mRNA; f:739657-740910